MTKVRFVILANEDSFDHLLWEKACDEYSSSIKYITIDLSLNNWLEKITAFNPDYLLLKPSGRTSLYRAMYQERVDILVKEFGYRVFPSYEELRIYENKRFFSYWAKANKIPHPSTYVFYNKKEAQESLLNLNFPLVGKINIGASGSGVEILKDRSCAQTYVDKAFSTGLSSKTGPKLKKGKLLSRILNKISNPKELRNRLFIYKEIAKDVQKDFIIIQEFIPHKYEWRVVRIGSSFFAHKKLKLGEKASGSLKKGYDKPPIELIEFVEELTEKHNFKSVAIDIFTVDDHTFLVNEIQCIFGQSDPYQMLIDEKPGRFIKQKGSWRFEEGDFARNACYNLRIAYILEQLKKDVHNE